MLRVIIVLVPLVLAVFALIDCVQTADEDVQGIPKLAWVALIVLVWVLGPIAWLAAGKRGRRWFRGRPAGAGPGGRPVAPDDDPDFLRGLGRHQPPPRDDAPDPAPEPEDGEDNGPDGAGPVPSR